jgi:hypothetical protein
MDISDADRIKTREIPFQEIHPDPHQAGTAARFLRDVEGILETDPTAPTILRVTYDVLVTTLQEIEEGLTELGLHIDNRLMHRVKRALYYYTEETLRANCGCHQGEHNCTKKVFAKRYELIEHGCRDDRPEHWRRYL